MAAAIKPVPDEFFGRAAELRRLAQLLERPSRLVTITGPGGVGKTRLVLEYLRSDATRGGPGGAHFCALADAGSVEDVCRAVATALALPLGGDAAPAERVGRALAARGVVVVALDNFEQLVAVASPLLDEWRALAPEARFVVTSREVLRVAGEHVLALGPLELPREGHADEASSAAAVQLLIARVQQMRPEYAPASAELTALAAIARQLDGLPLALELAASRVRLLGAEALRARLATRLTVLSHAARDASGRSATLRGAVEASWSLLSPHEQSALAQCAVFGAAFAPEAFECVVDLSAHPEAPPPLDVLESLHGKSLLHAREAGGDGAAVGMYASLREYAREQLRAMGEADAVRRRHAVYYARAAGAWVERYDATLDVAALERLDRERDNIAAALEALLAWARPDPADAADMAHALLGLRALTLLRENRHTVLAWFDRVAAATADGALLDPALRARLLVERALLVTAHVVDAAAARAALEAARAAVARANDPVLQARLERCEGRWLRRVGQLTEARARLEGAIALFRAAGCTAMEAATMVNLGLAMNAGGDADAATVTLRHALDVLEQVAPTHALVNDARLGLAAVYLDQGRRDEARAAALRVLEPAAGARAPGYEAEARIVLGLASLDGERFDEALAEFDRAIACARRFGERWLEAVYATYAGVALFAQGRLGAAAARLAAGAAVLRRSGDVHHAALAEGHLAAVAAAEGRLAHAEAEFDAAERDLADTPLRRAVHLQRVHLDLARAAVAPTPDEAERARRAARERVAAAAVAPGATETVEVRAARRIARRALDAAGAATERAPVLVVHERGEWFRLPAQPRAEPLVRSAERAVLAALARHRAQAPGEVLRKEALVAAAWPGERMGWSSAENRLRVTIARLRKLGLGPIIRTAPEGYLLDEAVPLALAAAPS